jgi:hypothetical protein
MLCGGYDLPNSGKDWPFCCCCAKVFQAIGALKGKAFGGISG